MIVEDQSEAIAFLSRPESYGAHAVAVERIETHGAIVFLVGNRAYKLKRAVRYSYLDYSTVALRHRFCEAELTLNRRTAPELYLGVKSLNRSVGGSLAFDGDGPVVDFVVVMRRFDQADLFDRLAGRGALTRPLMLELAEAVVRFHADSPPTLDIGGFDGLAEVLASNGQNLALADPAIFGPADLARVNGASRAILHDLAALLDDRRRAGRVRHCHGDLHLRNICLIDGRPRLFDCIEFSRSLACIDLLYDLAFLLMDLRYRGLGDLANGVLNRYLDVGDESPEGLATLPLFLSARAAIRAHIAVAAAGQQSDAGTMRRLADEARSYLSMAEELLRPAPPVLVAIGGLSGTGKSTLAYGLAPELGPAPGARVLRSDVLRKRLMAVPVTTALPDAAYQPEVTEKVYATLCDEASRALAAGHSVIVDAVSAREAERDAIVAVARDAGAPFVGFWLEAPDETLAARIAARGNVARRAPSHGRAGHERDASDATIDVLRRQLTFDLGRLDWVRLDAAADPHVCLAEARSRLSGLNLE